ncbi:MAG: hypothetical protein Fur0041_13010 [Bacteroidia bacterium]
MLFGGKTEQTNNHSQARMGLNSLTTDAFRGKTEQTNNHSQARMGLNSLTTDAFGGCQNTTMITYKPEWA